MEVGSLRNGAPIAAAGLEKELAGEELSVSKRLFHSSSFASHLDWHHLALFRRLPVYPLDVTRQ